MFSVTPRRDYGIATRMDELRALAKVGVVLGCAIPKADTSDALTLQRPLPDEALRIVAKGERSDGVAFA